MRTTILILSGLVLLAGGVQCNKDEAMIYPAVKAKAGLASQNVVVLVIDGPRKTETWDDPDHKLIPNLAGYFAKNGVVYTNFKNSGGTYTLAGHTAITTGYNQEINNSGNELPQNPSVFQSFLKSSGLPSNRAWIITSKYKLDVLANCKNSTWKGKYQPSYDCGIDGDNRDDAATLVRAKEIMTKDHPRVTLIQFKEPDYSGHANDWDGYRNGIRTSDSLAMELWKFIQSDPVYADKTTLLITNDHGRHNKGWKDGFVSHGDNCEGCRNIMLVGVGPDFKKNMIVSKEADQTDVTSTVASILQVKDFSAQGKVLDDLFEKP